MSWREVLEMKSQSTPYTQNSHNTQKANKPFDSADIANYAYHKRKSIESSHAGNSAHIADSALRDSLELQSKLLEDLAIACRGQAITPMEIRAALSPEDIEDWCKGNISIDTLAVFVQSLLLHHEMDQGKCPAHYTQHAICKHCGPVWLWFSGEVLGCPWCLNRMTGQPIPRPQSIRCGDCTHFRRIDHPNLGHCVKGQQEAIAGLWDADFRNCCFYIPLSKYEEKKNEEL